MPYHVPEGNLLLYDTTTTKPEMLQVNSTVKLSVTMDVETQPTLQPLTGERFKKKSVNTGDEARLDVTARGFWRRGNIIKLMLMFGSLIL